MSAFRTAVYNVVRTIPKGSVLTYKEVAYRAGYPNASRAVGNVLHQNTDPAVPCHRVVRSDGTLGGYRDGTAQKRARLATEGVPRDILQV